MAERPPAALTLLVDTNVVLDAVLARTPWAGEAAALLDAVSRGRARGVIAAHAVTTVYYIVARANGRGAATTAVADLLAVCDVAPLGAAEFQRALALALPDYEDAVQVAAALQVGADFLVSRDLRHLRNAPVAVRSAAEVLPLLPGGASR